MANRAVMIVGGGPAGSAAAMAALAEGAAVTLYEKTRFPRHKVCGEFLSPEILPILESLNLDQAFFAANPARLTRAVLHLGAAEKRFRLPEPAFSLSRFAFDHLLLTEAARRGADIRIESKIAAAGDVVAHGRQTPAPKGNRLFGFKTHFRGAADDAVEMFFFGACYVGVSPVEGGAINVCGLAPEALLRAHDFHPEPLFPASLRERLRGFEQSFDWLITGPLVFHEEFRKEANQYLAGDALGFVDPFTGTGMLSALITGKLAGESAARQAPVESYNAECRRILRRQYSVASMIRRALGAGVAESLARWIPGPLLYRLTRPAI